MFPMTVTISNPAQLNAVMAALNVGGIVRGVVRKYE